MMMDKRTADKCYRLYDLAVAIKIGLGHQKPDVTGSLVFAQEMCLTLQKIVDKLPPQTLKRKVDEFMGTTIDHVG